MPDAPAPIPRLTAPTIASMQVLDRVSIRRGDADLVARLRTDPSSRLLLMVDLKVSLEPGRERDRAAIRWYSPRDLDRLGIEPDITMLLGLDGEGHARFVASLEAANAARSGNGRGAADLEPLADLRTLATEGALAPDDLAIVGEARALAGWHRAHRCCGRCGARTRVEEAGWRRTCWACGQSYFPRSDPAVIMLVSDGARCLLGRHSGFPENFYSVLAGFVEPGEDIEDAVRRETLEEAGIKVGRVDYLGSQPWPFPHSLMIGCWAEALTSAISRDQDELEDVRWFPREEVRLMLRGDHAEGIRVPGKLSIARALIDRFAEGG